MNICVQVHKRIYVRSPGYMSDLLVSNSDINERNNRNDSLNLVSLSVKSMGGHSFGVWAIRLWNAVSNSLKMIECVH